jgi:Tfp pilus assembly protein PilE
MICRTANRYPGFTVMEMVVVLVALTVVMLVVAQLATMSMIERVRLSARHAAVELAANILERARAEPVEALTPAWAGAQQLHGEESALPPDCELQVRVEPEKATPGAHRVTVGVSWSFHSDEEKQTVQLVGVFGPRSAAGGKK